jgi:hypothetical protein
MDRRFSYASITSHIYETKSDIISCAIGNPINQRKSKLSKINRNFLGSDIAKLFVKRHNNELQRCSQFYSLASIFNETSTKDKHQSKWNDIKKRYFTQLFQCFQN